MNDLILRPHQTRLRELVHHQFRLGHRKVCAVLPTGAGKRYMGVYWCGQAAKQGKRSLVATDRKLLVQQMAREMERFGVDCGVIMANEPRSPAFPAQVASIQTVQRRYFQQPEGMPAADLVLIDECHKALDAYTTLMSLPAYADSLWVGLTATPVDAQGRTLAEGRMYDAMVEGATNSQLIAEGMLVPTRVWCPSEPDLQGVKIERGEYVQGDLGRRVESVTLFADVFREVAKWPDRKWLVFPPGVAYARGLAKQFSSCGVSAEVIEANTSSTDRRRILNDFETGDLRMLISVDVLREGFDAPIASAGIDLQPNRQLRTFWQKVGRVKRTYPGKEYAVWIDMAGNLARFTHPNDDPNWAGITGDLTAQDVCKPRNPPKPGEPDNPDEPKLIICPKCHAERPRGKVCPACGYEHTGNVRFVRCENGTMREVTAAVAKIEGKSRKRKLLDEWASQLWAAHKTGRTLGQAARLFQRETGAYVEHDWPCAAKQGSADWARRVKHLYPAARDLAQATQSIKETA